MAERHMMRVTCKCAFYTPSGDKVLITEYAPGLYGLPGGHIDAGETPDQAIVRELHEELGLTVDGIERRDFWMHHDNKIVLGYTGTLDEATKIVHQVEEMRGVLWVNVDDIASGNISIPSYGEFICKFRPVLAG